MTKTTVTKIISGGQTGADQAGLRAGRMLGIKTGGTAPPEFMTETGPNLALKEFNLAEGEHDPYIYPKRTRKNVIDSDGTILFGNVASPGCRLTIKCCQELNKPYAINPDSRTLVQFVHSNNITVLNVAGNRESKSPGIFDTTRDTIVRALGDT